MRHHSRFFLCPDVSVIQGGFHLPFGWQVLQRAARFTDRGLPEASLTPHAPAQVPPAFVCGFRLAYGIEPNSPLRALGLMGLGPPCTCHLYASHPGPLPCQLLSRGPFPMHAWLERHFLTLSPGHLLPSSGWEFRQKTDRHSSSPHSHEGQSEMGLVHPEGPQPPNRRKIRIPLRLN